MPPAELARTRIARQLRERQAPAPAHDRRHRTRRRCPAAGSPPGPRRSCPGRASRGWKSESALVVPGRRRLVAVRLRQRRVEVDHHVLDDPVGDARPRQLGIGQFPASRPRPPQLRQHRLINTVEPPATPSPRRRPHRATRPGPTTSARSLITCPPSAITTARSAATRPGSITATPGPRTGKRRRERAGQRATISQRGKRRRTGVQQHSLTVHRDDRQRPARPCGLTQKVPLRAANLDLRQARFPHRAGTFSIQSHPVSTRR